MFNKVKHLQWEYIDNRSIESAILVRVNKVKPLSLFQNFMNSPSYWRYVPNARDLSATVITGRALWSGLRIQLRISDWEIKDIEKNNLAIMALIGDHCVGIAKAPSSLKAAEFNNWLISDSGKSFIKTMSKTTVSSS